MLRRLVRAESPSYDKAALDQVSKIIATEWRGRGARVAILRQRERGNHVRAELWLGRGRPIGQFVIVGDLDTVFVRGTIAQMPFRIARGRAWGPGTFDMKSGLVIALYAVEALRRVRISPLKRFVFLWSSDDVFGSQSSQRIIE